MKIKVNYFASLLLIDFLCLGFLEIAKDKKRIAKHEDIYKKMTNSPEKYE